MLKEELKQIDITDKAVKKTGLTIGIFLIFLSLLLWYAGKTTFIYFSAIGGLMVILAMVAVPVLRPFHKYWMVLALIIGFVMSRLILTILFYLVLTPIGIVAKLSGKRFFSRSFDKNAITYWEKVESPVKQKVDYERQF